MTTSTLSLEAFAALGAPQLRRPGFPLDQLHGHILNRLRRTSQLILQFPHGHPASPVQLVLQLTPQPGLSCFRRNLATAVDSVAGRNRRRPPGSGLRKSPQQFVPPLQVLAALVKIDQPQK